MLYWLEGNNFDLLLPNQGIKHKLYQTISDILNLGNGSSENSH